MLRYLVSQADIIAEKELPDKYMIYLLVFVTEVLKFRIESTFKSTLATKKTLALLFWKIGTILLQH